MLRMLGVLGAMSRLYFNKDLRPIAQAKIETMKKVGKAIVSGYKSQKGQGEKKPMKQNTETKVTRLPEDLMKRYSVAR